MATYTPRYNVSTPAASEELLHGVDLMAVTDLAQEWPDPVLGTEPGADQAGLQDAVDLQHLLVDTVSLWLPVPGLLVTQTPGVCSAAVLCIIIKMVI